MFHVMKKTSLGLLIAALMISMTAPVMAKTTTTPTDAPADSTAVLTVNIGTSASEFTYGDINGKNAYASETNTYTEKQDNKIVPKEWTGVSLAAILDAAASKAGVELQDNYKVAVQTADNYPTAFTVGDVKDADNHYIVSPDPVATSDGANAYARILRGDSDTTPNESNIRLVTGLTITDADGNAIAVSNASKAKTQGGDVENAVFYIAVKESADSAFKMYYYTLDELKAYDDVQDINYVNHSVETTTTGKGALLSNLLSDISDAQITDDMIVQYAEADGYHADAATAIDESNYKDKVSWLKESHVTAGGDTVDAVTTVIAYEKKESYAKPDKNHVNDTEWQDADSDSGYLRAYRQRPDANSAIIKTLMGVVVSADGASFTGKDGYTLSAKTDDGQDIEIIEPSTGKTYKKQSVTGLVPGMQYAVKAPTVNNAEVSESDTAVKVITAASGDGQKVTFTFTEKLYLRVDTSDGQLMLTYTGMSGDANPNRTQTPTVEEVEAHGTPYGYYDSMFYRYKGCWLDSLLHEDAGKDCTVTGTDGSELKIAGSDTEKYFVAYGYTASKGATNTAEGKRFTFAYAAPQLIIPSDGTLVGEAEASAEGNKMVTVAVPAVSNIKTAPTDAGFTDMENTAWAKDAVNALFMRGVVKGTSDTTYSPDANIRRGDFMLMLVRAYGLEAGEATEAFADVAADSYWADAIATAKSLGIAKGSENNFRPDESITREDAMVLLYRTMGQAGVTLNDAGDLSRFADNASVSDYAAAPVASLSAAGVINGSDGNLLPKDSMTRAQMAVALYNALSIK